MATIRVPAGKDGATWKGRREDRITEALELAAGLCRAVVCALLPAVLPSLERRNPVGPAAGWGRHLPARQPPARQPQVRQPPVLRSNRAA